MAIVQIQVDFVRNKRGGQSLVLGGYRYGQYIKYLGNFCQLLTFANSLDPDQAQQKVSRDQYPNRLTLWVRGFKIFIFVSGQAVHALKRFSDCVFPVTTSFRK